MSVTQIPGMVGQVAMSEDEVHALQSFLFGDHGVHIDIGVLWGGSMIAAAQAKGGGYVIGIDPMDTPWWTGEKDHNVEGAELTPRTVLQNLASCGVAHMSSLIMAPSHPWPIPHWMTPISTILIDGDHSFDACLQDWRNASLYARQAILFHDYYPDTNSTPYPGITDVIHDYVDPDPNWKEAFHAGTLIAFTRA